MNILVTGGCGFIGSNLIRRLLAGTDHRALNVDLLTYAGCAESVGSDAPPERYELLQADIADAEAMRAAFARFQPDAVLHLAAETHVDRSIAGPARFIETNILGTYTLLEAARAYRDQLDAERAERFRFAHVSTDEVFGSLGPVGRFNETTAYDPSSPYSASKAASDHLARAWQRTYGLPVIVTNCSNNYGPYQFPEKLIPLAILKAISGEPIPVYGRGENVRDWLYVEDHADALLAVLERGRPGETYAIGGDCERRNIDLLHALCDALDALRPAARSYREQIAFVADRPGHDLRYAIDASKIQRELGWRPATPFAEGLRKTVQWYLDNEPWWRAILAEKPALARLGLQPSPLPPSAFSK